MRRSPVTRIYGKVPVASAEWVCAIARTGWVYAVSSMAAHLAKDLAVEVQPQAGVLLQDTSELLQLLLVLLQGQA